MYLAAIADAQSQTPAMPTQMILHPAMQQGGFYMPHPQAATMAQQPGMFQPRPHFNSNPHSLQDPQQLQNNQPHPQASQGQMALMPVGVNSGTPPHNDASLGEGSSGIPASNSSLNDI